MTERAWLAEWDELDHHEADTALVRQVIDEIWNAGNTELADELFARTYVNHGGLVPDLVQGPEGIKFSVALYRAAFPDLHISVDSLSSIDGAVQLHWTARSTFVDSPPGSSGAKSVKRELTGVTRSSLADGKIVESWTDWDSTLAREVFGVPQPRTEEAS